MANYKKDIHETATLELTAFAISNMENPRNKFLFALLYLTGARPSELRWLKRGDIDLREADDYITVKLHTTKLEAVKKFKYPFRTLEISKSAPFVQELIVPYLQRITNPEALLITISAVRMWQLLDAASAGRLCPYHFRHSRLYKLAQGGATTDQLMNWKGAADLRSISPYLASKPIGKKLVLE